MSYTLISATPSPYARKVWIALIEKGLPFALRTEVPWEGATETPRHNPLEKLPVLLLPDGSPDGSAVFESRYILEWLEAKHPSPRLLPDTVEGVLAARQIEVVADGVCDAVVLLFFEGRRAEPSPPWMARQRRKIEGGVAWLAARVAVADGCWLCGGRFGLAEIAAGTALRYLDLRFAEFRWREAHPHLAAFSDQLEQRASFAATVPVAQAIGETVV
jgi:glutathione S-transferase